MNNSTLILTLVVSLCCDNLMAQSDGSGSAMGEVPGCVTNMQPADGDTIYVSLAPYQFTWTAPTTGDAADTFHVHLGETPDSYFQIHDVPAGNTMVANLNSTDVGITYWWAVPSNAYGPATCTPLVHSVVVLAAPLVGINEAGRATFTAYPNPVRDMLMLSGLHQVTRADVLNTLGQTVLSQPVSAPDGRIDMSALPKGVYLVRITSADGLGSVKQVVKE